MHCFALITQKLTSIELKFGGQVFQVGYRRILPNLVNLFENYSQETVFLILIGHIQ